MDPRQCLPLELGWEACEDAHVAPDRLKGAPAGVFVGVCGHDYATLLRKQGGVTYLRGELCGAEPGTAQVMAGLARRSRHWPGRGGTGQAEAALATMPDGDGPRSAVAERLQAVVRRVSGARAGTEESSRELDLCTATHEEVFALIDDELGAAVSGTRRDVPGNADRKVSNGE